MSVTIEVSAGELLDSGPGQRIVALHKSGFRFQASVGVDPTKQRFIPASEQVKVNNRTLKSPRGFVLVEAGELREADIVQRGADDLVEAGTPGAARPPLFAQTTSGHGRVEVRPLAALALEACAVDFPFARSTVVVRSETTIKKTGTTTAEQIPPAACASSAPDEVKTKDRAAEGVIKSVPDDREQKVAAAHSALERRSMTADERGATCLSAVIDRRYRAELAAATFCSRSSGTDLITPIRPPPCHPWPKKDARHHPQSPPAGRCRPRVRARRRRPRTGRRRLRRC